MGLRRVLIRALNAAGLEVARIKPALSPLMHHRINVLFDVGANKGQYARDCRKLGYQGQIISFEPLPEAYELLSASAKHDQRWTVHNRCAIGAEPGETEINISQNSQSSSILPILKAHVDAAASSRYVGTAKTNVITLDSVFDLYCKPDDKIFLKIDTQGFEAQVLKGAEKSLSKIAAVQLEMSIVPLYEGQKLYDYFIDYLRERGFFLWSLESGFFDKASGQHLQFDATFVRNDLASVAVQSSL
jgi:FkbM family methyltransferase